MQIIYLDQRHLRMKKV